MKNGKNSSRPSENTKPIKCIVCGKETEREIKLPHGKFAFCGGPDCLKTLLWKSEGALPVVWAGPQELVEHELMTPEEADLLETEDVVFMTEKMGDYLWDGTFGSEYNDALEYGAQVLEHRKISRCKKENLPLLVGQIKHRENQKFLDERIKNA